MILRDEFGVIDEAEHRVGEPQAPIERLEAAMLMLPNVDRPWEEWNRYGMALYAASGGSVEGYELFRKWSAKSAKHNETKTRERWEHYHRSPPNRIGAGTLFYAAAAEWVDPGIGDIDDYASEESIAAADTPIDMRPAEPTTQQTAPKPNGTANEASQNEPRQSAEI